MKITKQKYVEYLISTPINYTCTNLADHLDGEISHDAINDYLRRENHTPHTIWELAKPLINNSKEAYLIVDDSIQNKQLGLSLVFLIKLLVQFKNENYQTKVC